MLHRPSEARLVRGIALALATGVGAYLAYAAYNSYAVKEDGLLSPGALGALALLALSLVLGFYYLYVHKTSSEFAVEVEVESRKVTWPEWHVVRRSTAQVTVVMVALMGFLFIADFVLTKTRELIY